MSDHESLRLMLGWICIVISAYFAGCKRGREWERRAGEDRRKTSD